MSLDSHHNHHDDHHDHTFDPDGKPPYITLGLLIIMVLIGLGLVVYYNVL